jgi:DNA invertase Pin-like site-specific DNA recombinase
VDSRLGFIALLEYCAAHDVGIVLAENASRFARDLIVQLIGHALLRERDIELIPVDAPSHFTDPTPTAEMVRQIRAPSASSRRSAWWPSCVMPASG